MQFPLYLWLGPLALHPHWLFESLGYFVGSRFYLWLKARRGDTIAPDDRWTVVAAAAVGAVLGGKLLYLASDPPLTVEHLADPAYLLGGKSVVGALAGGLVAVEWAKRRIGVTRSTGDLFAIPLAVGIAIGRIGCFLTGLDDHTHGLRSDLPWAVDFGDGTPRHPAQLYEVVFLAALVPVLARLGHLDLPEGAVFKAFMIAYFGFRLLLELIKPGFFVGGLNPIQWVCLVTLVNYASHAFAARRAVVLRG